MPGCVGGRGVDPHGSHGGGEGTGVGEVHLDAEGSGAASGAGRMRRASSVMAMASSSRTSKASEDLDLITLPAGAPTVQGGGGNTLDALTRSLAKVGGGQVRREQRQRVVVSTWH